MKPALGFLAVGAAGLLIYAGWLGYSPAFIARTLLTGEPMPTRRALNEPTVGAETAAATGSTFPTVPSSGTYPLTQGIPA